MTSTIHQPRIAWEAARSLTAAAQAGDATYRWCRDRVAAVLGAGAASALEATRRRLTDLAVGPNEVHVQRGLWRVRLEDALRNSPGLGNDLADLIADVAARR